MNGQKLNNFLFLAQNKPFPHERDETSMTTITLTELKKPASSINRSFNRIK